MNNILNTQAKSTAGRRMIVNGKLLSYKQTAQFEKFIEDEQFRARFMQLAEAK